MIDKEFDLVTDHLALKAIPTRKIDTRGVGVPRFRVDNRRQRGREVPQEACWDAELEPAPPKVKAGEAFFCLGALGSDPSSPIPTRSVVLGAEILFGTPMLLAAIFQFNFQTN